MADKKAAVLVVDDDASSRSALSALLDAEGFDVSAAEDGVEALESLAERSVDIVITDYQMPRMDGLEPLRKIRESYGDLVVIMLTGVGGLSCAIEAMWAGADDYLQKLAATNRRLENEVKEGRFREDLYYRLNVVGIEMPPLRIRPGDVALLAEHFPRKYANENGKGVRTFSTAAMKRLVEHSWPGIVRELENVIERAVVMCQRSEIGESDMPTSLGSSAHLGVRVPVSTFAENREGRHRLDPRDGRVEHDPRSSDARDQRAHDPRSPP